MLEALYIKSELAFALVWIAVYVVAASAGDELSRQLGVQSSITLVITALLSAVMIAWLVRYKRTAFFGLCKSSVAAKTCLYYLPLVVLASCNLWGGITLSLSSAEAVCYMLSMLFIGFLEEVIFRGLLFRAMAKQNVRAAMIVSSVTFGIGHLVNLINGSGADPLSNLLQVAYAIAIGFLFTYLFYKTGSLWACIVTHAILNALSVFAPPDPSPTFEIVSAALLCLISIAYLFYLRTAFKAKHS